MQSFHFPDPSFFDGAVILRHIGVISAEGPDAASFLHGQLSQDVSGQQPAEARLAAFCSPKGRMLASFLILKPQTESLQLLTDAGILPAVLKRLSMFVMRAKARLTDASGSLAVVGLCGDSARQWLGDVATATTADWQVQSHGISGGQVVSLPEVLGARRWLWVGPSDQVHALTSALPTLSLPNWQWLDVMSGVVRIEPATVDQFVPQMVNFDVVGGVNFKKGCYPGQEIVARSQYRGTIKRRTFLLHADVPMQAGQEVFSTSDPAQPAGLVVNAAAMPGPDGQPSGAFSALVELKWQALNEGWNLASPQGPTLVLGTLPYEVPMGESNE
ncbi:MAG: folate-binding protein YgfZ [Burkholderiales bacterium]|nr:folate-binding protein YgfZ [Burkholderiales bacterium]